MLREQGLFVRVTKARHLRLWFWYSYAFTENEAKKRKFCECQNTCFAKIIAILNGGIPYTRFFT